VEVAKTETAAKTRVTTKAWDTSPLCGVI
jgi:hypothetical protein